MLLFDVNIYVYAHREDSPHHKVIRAFLEDVLSGSEPVGHSGLALSGFLRIVTHPRIFDPPTDLETALRFTSSILDRPDTLSIEPGSGHRSIFEGLLRRANARGNLIPDAWFAALAMEHGSTWVSTDGDYARFEGLSVLNPLTRYATDISFKS